MNAAPTRLYFTAPDGVVYRVLDVVMKDGTMHASNPPASWAKSRVFGRGRDIDAFIGS